MYELHINAMTCGGCAKRVTDAIKGVDTDARIEADLSTRVVRVQSTVALDEFQSAIAAIGFPDSSDD